MSDQHTAVPRQRADRQKRLLSWVGIVAVVVTVVGANAVLADDKKAETATSEAGITLFRTDVAPVLAGSCFECHGGQYRKSGFNLSTRDGLLTGGDTGPAIVPGDAANSLLYQLITHQREPTMPRRADKLSDEAIAKIAEWINAGAPYAFAITSSEVAAVSASGEPRNAPAGSDVADARRPRQPTSAPAEHWSFKPPTRPELPSVHRTGWVRNPIDAFVLAHLEAENVEPSPEADRYTLIRRLCLDLLGLLPSREEVQAFMNDSSPDAYEKLVDRLLASPHFGERWARHWLDLARYADSDGFEKDSPRPWAWRYRDWVIDAINHDLPFDEFTVEQLAGDLLPDPTIEQLVATGFHRNTLTNREGGVDPEQFRVEQVIDRLNTTGSVWLGLTVACAQCHSHKFDPITQREYYSLYAFFNQADERDIPAPLANQLPQYQREKRAYDAVQGKLHEALTAYDQHQLPIALETWERELRLPDPYWQPLEASFASSAEGATITTQADKSLLVSGIAVETDRTIAVFHTEVRNISAIRIEALPHASLGSNGPGRAPNGNFVLSELTLRAAPSDNPTALQQVELHNPSASFAQDGWPAGAAIDGDPAKGWAIQPRKGQRSTAVFETRQPIDYPGGAMLVLTLDQNYGQQHVLGHFRISVTSAKPPVKATGIPDDVARAVLTPVDKRDDAQKKRLLSYYRTVDPERARLQKTINDHAATSPDTRVVRAQTLVRTSTPRTTHVHIRGDFLRPGDEVRPGVPAVLPELMPRNGTPDRLDLARWIMAKDNPLTARVAVNRIWMYLFGTGIVATPGDFGTRGDLPSHPQLLDWLATEYQQRDWSRKAMIKLIVTSATYRQASITRPELDERDPKNRWLARQNRFRMAAEIVRDLNLEASGLLYEKIGGPSVRPPQPEGIAELTYAGSASWKVSPAPDRYRRGLYIWFQRTSPFPMLMTFDGPDSNLTCTRRRRSNTPLQSLTLLNDPVFVECAQHLGKRVADAMSGSPAERIVTTWQLCLTRPPEESEARRLVQLYQQALASYQKDEKAGDQLLGDMPVPEDRLAETAAWATVARVLLNLDEFITRG